MSADAFRRFRDRVAEFFGGRKKEENKEEIKTVKKAEAGELTEVRYSPGYSDMNGSSHQEKLAKDDSGAWTVTCRDRDDIENPMVERTYAVSAEAVEEFAAFLRESGVLDFVNREESHDYCDDYSEWGYSIRFDNTALGGDRNAAFRFGEYQVYSKADRVLLAELKTRFEALRGELLSEITEEE